MPLRQQASVGRVDEPLCVNFQDRRCRRGSLLASQKINIAGIRSRARNAPRRTGVHQRSRSCAGIKNKEITGTTIYHDQIPVFCEDRHCVSVSEFWRRARWTGSGNGRRLYEAMASQEFKVNLLPPIKHDLFACRGKHSSGRLRSGQTEAGFDDLSLPIVQIQPNCAGSVFGDEPDVPVRRGQNAEGRRLGIEKAGSSF